ncbi:MAG: hypothetical protein MMC33_006320 [Icmadophila ericetorum]|nr:hypothetical protein [Icmadophila ericetorum]
MSSQAMKIDVDGSRDGFELGYLRTCISVLTTTVPCPYILVGGGSVILYGSMRCTNDLGILVPETTDIGALTEALAAIDAFTLAAGALSFTTPAFYTPDPINPDRKPSPVGLDLLRHVPHQATYEEYISKYMHMVATDNTKVMTLPIALDRKLACRYKRQEDANGIRKEASDPMLARGMIVDDESAKAVKISHYNLLLLGFNCNEEEVDVLRRVGCSKFLRPYEEDTNDQREFYEIEGAEAGSDPLAVELKELTDEDDEKGEEEEEHDTG